MYRKRKQLMELAVCVIDALAVLFSLFVAGILRYHNMSQMMGAENMQELCSMILVVHIASYYFLKVYDGFFQRGRYSELILTIKYNIVLVAGAMLIGFSMKNVVFVSRLVMGYFFVINTILIWLIHIFIRNKDRVLHWSKRRVTNLLVVTTKEYFTEIQDRFEKSKETTWNIMGVVLLNNEENLQELNGVKVISDTEDAYLEYATLHVVDEVFIQLDAIQSKEHFLKNMILEFEKMGVVVNLNLDLFNLGVTGEKRIYSVEKYNVIAFSSRLFDYRMVMVKRLIDIAGALVGLSITLVVGIVLAPILLLESPGPLIFKQKRVGENGRIFDFYKFRSMYQDAEVRKKELMEKNEMQGLMFKMENDPRITKVGAFIRKTSLDELPQFWNVLKGDMSLVGTRPPTVDEYQQYSYYQKRRISFRPGITGLWQISGRSNIKNFDEVVKLDLEYIDNWSILLDFKIIFKTILVVLRGSGAR
ncbi:sugar transferase [Hominiventricola filiformis]|uniref:Sugar transferase n=1 Tax=Hominiventricola filiformis TaxID=2885352 RepID=A0AAE3DBJ4_9FIRM|nr:sugar transferase [Hominiventricola filiformis]MCC2125389.1 sugar transferase [Hominiventricola filiformis]